MLIQDFLFVKISEVNVPFNNVKSNTKNNFQVIEPKFLRSARTLIRLLAVKSVRIRSFSRPYSVRMRENTNQKIFPYGHFSLHFYTPKKPRETVKFSDVFNGHRDLTLETNGLRTLR